MTKEETKTQEQVKEQTKRPEIIASCDLWARFEKWMEVQSCQTLAEGFRAAMKQVTGFNSQSQEQNT